MSWRRADIEIFNLIQQLLIDDPIGVDNYINVDKASQVDGKEDERVKSERLLPVHRN